MKAILMSIKPKWCEKIFSGEKTIEVRKVAPKLEPPFKVYVYCTKQRILGELIICKSKELSEIFGYGSIVGVNKGVRKDEDDLLCGKVIGEFVCDKVNEIKPCFEYYADGYDINDDYFSETCLTRERLQEYGKGKSLYGWHITKVKLYDKPKELDGFWTVRCTNKTGECKTCEVKPACISNVTRPPQSWMYVEELC